MNETLLLEEVKTIIDQNVIGLQYSKNYSAIEDLIIYYYMGSGNSDNKKYIIRQIRDAYLPHRSPESLRSRFKDYIANFRLPQVKNLVAYMKHNNHFKGYLEFQKDSQTKTHILVQYNPDSQSLKKLVLDELLEQQKLSPQPNERQSQPDEHRSSQPSSLPRFNLNNRVAMQPYGSMTNHPGLAHKKNSLSDLNDLDDIEQSGEQNNYLDQLQDAQAKPTSQRLAPDKNPSIQNLNIEDDSDFVFKNSSSQPSEDFQAEITKQPRTGARQGGNRGRLPVQPTPPPNSGSSTLQPRTQSYIKQQMQIEQEMMGLKENQRQSVKALQKSTGPGQNCLEVDPRARHATVTHPAKTANLPKPDQPSVEEIKELRPDEEEADESGDSCRQDEELVDIGSQFNINQIILDQFQANDIEFDTGKHQKELDNMILVVKQTKQKNKGTQIVRQFMSNDQFEANKLSNFLKSIQRKLNITSEELISYLDKISWNVNDLQFLLSDNSESLKKVFWDNYEDQILREVDQKNSNYLNMLIKFKGVDKVKQRCKFLKLNLPFQL